MDRLVAPGALVGQRLADRYHLLRVLSEDAVAEVYEADDERLERHVTVRVFDGDAPEDPSSPDVADPSDVLDAGEHDGRAYVVLPFVEGAVTVATGPGDDEPTRELPTSTDHTIVMPLPLVPVPEPVPSAAEPSRGSAATGGVAAQLWARRALLATLAAIVLVVVLLGLAARNDGLDVPTGSTEPVSVDTTTTFAPTTTSPPTTERPASEGHGKGKGKKDDD